MRPSFVAENFALLTALHTAAQKFEIPEVVYHAVHIDDVDEVRKNGLAPVNDDRPREWYALSALLECPLPAGVDAKKTSSIVRLHLHTDFLYDDAMAPPEALFDAVFDGTSLLLKPSFVNEVLGMQMPLARCFVDLIENSDEDDIRALLQPLWRASLFTDNAPNIGAKACAVCPEALVGVSPYKC